MKLPWLPKNSIIGLDVGSSSIKLAQLVQRENGLALVRLETLERTHPEDPSPLKELLRRAEIHPAKVIVAFNGPQTGIRILSTPPMPQKELKEAVRLESKNYFPFPLHESFLEFEKLGETVEGGTKKIQMAVATTTPETVEETLTVLKKAGIRPDSLIPVAYALQKWAKTAGISPGETQCLVDLGDRYTELMIFKEAGLLFSRKIPVAGRDFTQALTGVLVSDRGKTQLSLEEAERVKQEVGIPREGESERVDDKISKGQLLSMLRSPLEQLVSEMDRCFDYFREETGGGKVDSILLLGRGSMLKGLARALSEALGIEVKVGDPLKGLRIESQMMAPDDGFAPFAVALGAALSLGRGINLLPPEIKGETRQALRRALVQSVVSTVVLLAAFFYIGMKIQRSNYEKRIAVARMEMASLKPELETVQAQSLANQVLAAEPYWDDAFKELSNTVPGAIHLTKLGMANQRLVMKGKISSEEKERVLSDFILDLEKGIFKNVKLVTAKETADQSVSEFEIDSWVD